uniref:LolA family protein n=1 Tax=uncultured Bilophila sp. TaxID=529385 RepID=UPI0025DA2F6C|nr:outer membrane lipoprotein carrier protein LolA [uncultured Bilophila sp.]
MRFSALFACAVALLFLTAGASHAAAPGITGEMQKKYEAMQSFTAEFTQRLVHQESGAEEVRKGTLAFQKPLRVRWETKAPHGELLVITDKEVWDYLPDEELAYQYSPEVVRDSRSVIQVITGQTRLDTDFSVEAEPDDNGLAVLRLYPKDPSPQLVEAILWVDKNTKLIRKAQILDFYGNTNEVTLTSLTPDAPIKAGTFQFTPPQGTTVENLMDQVAPERPLLQ